MQSSLYKMVNYNFPASEMLESAVRYRDYLLSFAKNYFNRNSDNMEDSLGDLYVKILNGKASGFSGKSSVRTYLSRMLLNMCRDNQRKLRVRKVSSLEENTEGQELWGKSGLESPDYTLLRREESLKLDRALNQLDSTYQKILRMHFYEGLGLKEISEKLGIPDASVRGIKRKGLIKLRKILGEDFLDAA